LWGSVEAKLCLIERTNNVAERSFRRLKQRTRRMGNFMSEERADNFLEAWSVYVNFEPYQVRRERKRRYRYPGQSPLAIGQANVQGYCWLDALEI
jgi:transposase-like protein